MLANGSKADAVAPQHGAQGLRIDANDAREIVCSKCRKRVQDFRQLAGRPPPPPPPFGISRVPKETDARERLWSTDKERLTAL